MKADKNHIYNIVTEEVTKLRDTLPPEQYFAIDWDTALFGKGSTIDSLSLVSVIVDLEERLSREFRMQVSLTDDDAMTREISPYENVTNLTDYIIEVLAKKGNRQFSDYV